MSSAAEFRRPLPSDSEAILNALPNPVLLVAPDAKVREVKVAVGRRVGDRVEITGGLEPGARVVASGGAFLSDGDTVRIVDGAASPAAAPAPVSAGVKAK